jgi:hypothetical protein
VPSWIGGFNEGDFFFACEVFQVFFAGYGVIDVFEGLVVDEAVDFVFDGEGVCLAFAMLAKADEEIVGDADVDGSGTAGENVDVILMVSHCL